MAAYHYALSIVWTIGYDYRPRDFAVLIRNSEEIPPLISLFSLHLIYYMFNELPDCEILEILRVMHNGNGMNYVYSRCDDYATASYQNTNSNGLLAIWVDVGYWLVSAIRISAKSTSDPNRIPLHKPAQFRCVIPLAYMQPAELA